MWCALYKIIVLIASSECDTIWKSCGASCSVSQLLSLLALTLSSLPPSIYSELRLGYNVTYIVAAVLLQEDKVLLIQEAKPSCRGAWYLPAGRMEANETIVVRL